MADSKRQQTVILISKMTRNEDFNEEDKSLSPELKNEGHQILRKWLGPYRGNWQGEFEEGAVMSFPSVSKAVYCAGAIQLEMKKHKSLSFQIGIHLGELILIDKHVQGPGVETANDISNLCKPGKIYASEQVSLTILKENNIQSKIVLHETVIPGEGPLNIYSMQVDFPEVERLAREHENLIRKGVVVEYKRNILTQRVFIISTGIVMLIIAALLLVWIVTWIDK